MKKKKAILFTLAVFAVGFAGGVFSGRYYAGKKPPAKVEAVEEKSDLKKDLAKIRALQKEITLYTDKEADAFGAKMAFAAHKDLPIRYGIPFGYYGEQAARRKEYYLANPDKIPFHNEEMQETKIHNAYITLSDKKDKLEKELKEFIDEKLYITDKQNLDLEAKYWAGRVLNDKDVTYEQLATNSVNWVGDGNLIKDLMMNIQFYVNSAHIDPLKKEEKETFDRNKDIVWALLHAGAFDAGLINSLSEQDCVDILSNHYAEYNKKHDWKWDNIARDLSSYKDGDKILAKSKEIVEQGKARHLSLEENEMANACIMKMWPDHPRGNIKI